MYNMLYACSQHKITIVSASSIVISHAVTAPFLSHPLLES